MPTSRESRAVAKLVWEAAFERFGTRYVPRGLPGTDPRAPRGMLLECAVPVGPAACGVQHPTAALKIRGVRPITAACATAA